MPEYTVIVTLNLVVRARGENDARRFIEAKVDEALQQITAEDWYTGPMWPEVDYYIERKQT